MNWLFDGEGIEFSHLIGLQSLKTQERILQKINGAGGPQSTSPVWTGFLSREKQGEITCEAFLEDNLGFFIYAVEEGREQEDIVLQRERLWIANGKPSWVQKNKVYLFQSAGFGCPSCGQELQFGLYRRCGHCRARLKYVLQCGHCDQLRVGVDVRVLAEEVKCEGCGKLLHKTANDPASEPEKTCYGCGAGLGRPPHSTGLCRRCRKAGQAK
jgi:hypothetical protein